MRARLHVLLVVGSLLGVAQPGVARSATHVGSIREALTAPASLCVEQDRIAVLEPQAGRILVYTALGVLAQEIDITEHASGLARFGTDSYLFCDPTHHRVATVDASTGRIEDFATALKAPVAVLQREDRWSILDAAAREILEADATGRILARIPLPEFSDAPLRWPAAMAWDSANPSYHVFDQLQARAVVVSAQGLRLREYGSFGAGDGKISRVGEIVCDAQGFAYVSDRYQGRVTVFDPHGQFVAHVGWDSEGAPLLSVPTGIATDVDGILYVASSQTASIEIFHFDRNDALRGSLIADAQYPRDLALAPFEGLRLQIGARALSSAGDPLSVDVQLDLEGGVGGTVASATELLVTNVVTDESDLRVGHTEWSLPLVLEPDRVYSWRARARAGELLGEWSTPSKFRTEPRKAFFSLAQNRPNPFNPRTTIEFTLAHESDAVLAIFDVRGQLLWQRVYHDLPAGRHQEVWSGVDRQGHPIASGIYFYRLVAGEFDETRKLVIVR